MLEIRSRRYLDVDQNTCGHSNVGERSDLKRLKGNGCYQLELASETIAEIDKCASYMEGETSVDAHDQDSTHPNVVRSVKEAFSPRTWPARRCVNCRRRHIRCDLAEPECGNCVRLGKKCSSNQDDESHKRDGEARKPEQARFLEFERSSKDEPSVPSLPSLSDSPTSSIYTSQPVHAVPGMAHNLSLSPQHRKRLPKWGPHHAEQSQLTDDLPSVTALRPLQTYGATPLRTLLAKYYLLDAISQIKPENVNGCLDIVHTEPPIQPLADSVDMLYAMPPKAWLVLRRMIRNLYTDVLHNILDIISDAKLYTDYVLSHTSSRPTLGPIERRFACPALFDCVRVRQHMLNMLSHEFQAFILKLRRQRVESGKGGHPDAPSPSARQSYAKSVPEKRMTQASRDSKRWLRTISQKILNRILHPTVQGKPSNLAIDYFMLTKLSKLNCDGL